MTAYCILPSNLFSNQSDMFSIVKSIICHSSRVHCIYKGFFLSYSSLPHQHCRLALGTTHVNLCCLFALELLIMVSYTAAPTVQLYFTDFPTNDIILSTNIFIIF